MAREVGIGDLSFFSRVHCGGGAACGTVLHAAMAVATGVAVAMRRHAATNPAAWFHGRPITLEEHQASRWIVEPLPLLDCCQESDGAVALVVTQLEELGFCERGEARHLVADGGIEIDGRLPVNPHGGQLGEAYIHGMNGIAEAVRQIRGTSVNQVADVRNVLVTAGTGVPTSGLVLSAG